jgi:outer membrane protein TolC
MRRILRSLFQAAVLGVALSSAASAGAQATADQVPAPPVAPPPRKGAPALESIGFEAAVARALARNPTALQADAEVRRVRALVEETRGASLPTLTGVAAYTRLDGNRYAGPALVAPDSAVNLAAVLTVPLINVRGWTQWQQASDALDVSRANAEDVRRAVAVATARAYLNVLVQRRLLATTTSARDSARSHYDFTHAQRVGGVGNRLDEARAAQELTTEEVLLQNQEVALFRAREALGVLVAGEGEFDATDWDFGETPTLGDALAEGQSGRADVRARARALRAADRRVDQAYADYMPALNLVASPFYQSVPVPTLPQTGWEAQLILTLPFYDGGLREGQGHEKKALADGARLELEGKLRQARSEVRTAYEELQRADAALDQARQSASFASGVLDMATRAYRGGATSNLEVIDAERQERDAQIQVAIAEDAVREARLDLLTASARFPAP